jgi:hypothetical protein
MTVCDWSAEAALPDDTSPPSVFVGKGLPTYESLSRATLAEGANDSSRPVLPYERDENALANASGQTAASPLGKWDQASMISPAT